MSEPWIKWYIGDHVRDTLHLSTAENGAYGFLRDHYYCQHKPLPDNDEILARIARLSLSDWSAMRSTIADFFDVRDGHWHHKRIEQVLADMASTRKARQDGAAKTNAKRWGSARPGANGVAQRVAQRSLSESLKGSLPEPDLNNPLPLPREGSERKRQGQNPGASLPALKADLQDVLDRIPNNTSAAVFQKAIAAALAEKGWQLQLEQPVACGNRSGRLDIVVTEPARIAIEVDRVTPRQHSIEKLRSVEGFRFVLLREGAPTHPIEGIDAVLARSTNRPCQRAFSGARWWMTHEGIEAKGDELGIKANPGESAEAFKQRILARTEQAKAGGRTEEEQRKVGQHLEELRAAVRRKP